jgi:hypothetical protein
VFACLPLVGTSVPDPKVFEPTGSIINCKDPDPSIKKQNIGKNFNCFVAS